MQDLHHLPKLRDSLSYLYVEHAVVNKKDQAIEYIRGVRRPGDDPNCNIDRAAFS